MGREEERGEEKLRDGERGREKDGNWDYKTGR